jgi:NAD(P)-dependent dehydrogenase (short-subunit alcohol dehydrogenase family)
MPRWTARDIPDQSGRTAIVTGANSGIGLVTAKEQARAGATVVLACRNAEKAGAAEREIRTAAPNATVEIASLDLGSLASIRQFADGVRSSGRQVDLLINNAGVMAAPRSLTADGFELQFGTNHLGHFLLLRGLLPMLEDRPGTRVVLLSSSGHRISDVSLDDWNFERTPYDPWVAYGRAKTANVLCAVALDRRHRADGVRAFAVHPGGIRTELGRHLTPDTLQVLVDRLAAAPTETVWKTVAQGAATTVYAATSPDLDGQGGVYLEDCHVSEITDNPDAREGVRAYALDPATADALWDLSERLVG